MFRSRKRKFSLDKKPDKTKKLKVSSKIFRSPSSTKTNNEAKSKLNKLLPDGYDSIILTANTKPVESFEENEAVFGCVRLPILTKEDAMVWVKKFERKTFTSYRTQRTWKKDDNTGLFKRKYICNVRNKDVAGPTTSATCKGSIIFTIKDQEEIQANPEYYLRDYPSQVIIHFCHNHKIDPDSYMKNLRPSAELRIIFGTYFAKGHSPFSALICHKCDLHSSYGAEFYNVVSNGAICPSYNWCFREYEKFFLRKFIEPPEDKLNEKLKDAVAQYNAKWRSECAIISHNPLFVLSLCTPLMKSIFRSGFAEELITVRCFNTPKTSPKRQKLILFLCHTPIGSLPFGVVITFEDDIETACEGIRSLIRMFDVPSYDPKTIIIDENALLNKALKICFPNAQVLFNEFQMLQSIWRITRVVCIRDDEEFQALYNLFLVTLNSNSEEEFTKNFDGLLIYADKYPKLTNFLRYFKVRSNSYVLYARPQIEFNTDVLNYTDSGTVLLQDVSIKYGNFFNIVQLFDFISKSYVDHYERKLNKIVAGDLKGFFKTNFYVPLSKIADFTCEKKSDTEFLVSLNDMRFYVNAELDTCTCQVGVHGGSCVHQYIVEKNLGLVPECYTPLCDDMSEIFRNILKEKNIRPPLPDTDRLSELGSALDSLKSELESLDDPEEDYPDLVTVSCSEASNYGEMSHDTEPLDPLDEIFLVPPDITDSFTDVSDDRMSPLVLSEVDETNEDSEDCFDDSQQYNRESGEIQPTEFDDAQQYNRRKLQPTESSNSARETKPQNTVLFSENLQQPIPTGLILTQDNAENVIIYEFTEDGIKSNNEETVKDVAAGTEESLVHLSAHGSIVLSADVQEYNITGNSSTDVEPSVVYTYADENAITENDRRTAEIAEFLTNLPDTNNSNHHQTRTNRRGSQVANVIYDLVDVNDIESQKVTRTPYVIDKRISTSEEAQTTTHGVVVVKNDEYFADYKVLEGNVSVLSQDSNAFTDNNKRRISNPEMYEQSSPQNLINDTYEGNNFIMMSPNDLFDDNQNVDADVNVNQSDGKINVLSSLVIKPPIKPRIMPSIKPPITPPIKPPVYTPLHLNTIKHKTLRNVKESIRMGEPIISQSNNTIFVHDSEKSEPRKIVLPIIIKRRFKRVPNLKIIKNSDVTKSNQIFEKDVIKLYCNESGDKQPKQDSNLFQQGNKTPLEKAYKKENLEVKTLQIQAQEISPNNSKEFNQKYQTNDSQEIDPDVSEVADQEFKENELKSEVVYDSQVHQDVLSDKEVDADENEEEESKTYDFQDDSQRLDIDSESVGAQDVSDRENISPAYDKDIDLEEPLSVDYDPEELAKNDFIEIIEIDSDGLEQLASQKFDPALIFETPEHSSTGTFSEQMSILNKYLAEGTNMITKIQNLDRAKLIESKENAEEKSKTFKNTLPSKESGLSIYKRFENDNQKLTNTNKITMESSDSDETDLSDFDNFSEDSYSEVDDLCEDEWYESQYLWDGESSDESTGDVGPSGTTYKNPLKKEGVEAIKKPLSTQSDKGTNRGSITTNKITFPPSTRVVPRRAKTADSIKTDKPKPRITYSSSDDSLERFKPPSLSSINDSIKVSTKGQGKIESAEIQLNETSNSIKASRKEHTLRTNYKLVKVNWDEFQKNKKLITNPPKSCSNDNSDGPSTKTDKGKIQLSSKPTLKVGYETKRTAKSAATPRKSRTSQTKNYDENTKNSGYSSSSSDEYTKDFKRKRPLRSRKSLKDEGLGKKTKQITHKKGKYIKTEDLQSGTNSTENADQSDISLNRDLAEKTSSVSTDHQLENNLKVSPKKPKIRVDPKILKNRKLLNTRLNLISLPNILLQPKRVTSQNKVEPSILNSTAPPNKKSADVKTRFKPITKHDGFSPSNENVTVSATNLSPVTACDKQLNSKELKPTLEKMSVNPKPVSQMGKDIEDLEAILTSDRDIDREVRKDEPNRITDSDNFVLQNNDLLFLFDDARFETVIEDDDLSIAKKTLMVPANANKSSDVHKETLYLKKDEDSKKNIKRKHDDILNVLSGSSAFSVKKEARLEKRVKYIQNTSLTKQDVQTKGIKRESSSHNNTSSVTTSQLTVQLGEKNVVTLFIYPVVPRDIAPITPPKQVLSNTQNNPLRAILPKPEVSSPENNTKVIDEGNLVTSKVVTNKQNVNKSKISIKKKERNDPNPAEIYSLGNGSRIYKKFCNLPEITIKRSKQGDAASSDSLSETNKLEIRKDIQMRPNKKTSNSNQTLRSKSNRKKDTSTSEMEFHDLAKIDLVHPRRSARGEAIGSKEAKDTVSNKSIDTKSIFQEEIRDLLPKYRRQKSYSKSFAFDSVQRRMSPKMEKLKKYRTRQSFSNVSAENINLNDKSDDFDTSIAVSVLKKQQTQRKKSIEFKKKRALAASTLKSSNGYEDAFKVFIESSNPSSSNKQHDQSLSDFEKDTVKSDRGQTRRRRNSISSPKEKRFDNKKRESEKMKKSVNWDEVFCGFNESNSDSDDSEIKDAPNKKALAREERKKVADQRRFRSNISKKRDKLRQKDQSRSVSKYITHSTYQDINARLGTSDTDEEQINRHMSDVQEKPRTSAHTLKRKDGIVAKKCSKRNTRLKDSETNLVVVLEKNKQLDKMCLTRRDQTPALSRSRHGERVGYKELLNRAKLFKDF